LSSWAQKSKLEGLPCYTFADNGERQSPDEFERTFLSLSAGNKKSNSFVQGKLNMGSSGVLRYCGRHWFKLIVSRRYDGNGDWGRALTRRRPVTETKCRSPSISLCPAERFRGCFPAQKDRAVIIVDAGGLSFSAHNEIWTGGREHISNTNILRTAS
jgi:hypothetical protein